MCVNTYMSPITRNCVKLIESRHRLFVSVSILPQQIFDKSKFFLWSNRHKCHVASPALVSSLVPVRRFRKKTVTLPKLLWANLTKSKKKKNVDNWLYFFSKKLRLLQLHQACIEIRAKTYSMFFKKEVHID